MSLKDSKQIRRQGLQTHTVGLHIRRLIRTTNSLERLNREIRRRTRVVSIFPNENACLRLVSAILIVFKGSWSYTKLKSQAKLHLMEILLLNHSWVSVFSDSEWTSK